MKRDWISSLVGTRTPSTSVTPPAPNSEVVKVIGRTSRSGAPHEDAPRGKHFDVLPLELLTQARRHPRSTFVHANQGTPILLVRVEGPGDPLSLGLFIASASAGSTLFPSVETTSSRLKRMGGSLCPSGAHVPAHQLVRRELESGPHFAVLVRARAAETERAALGRARTNDVVLQNESVSKLHAWLVVDDRGQLFVTDAESKNGTRVNERKLLPHEATEVSEGDRITLGAVQAMYCRAGTFWDAVSGVGP